MTNEVAASALIMQTISTAAAKKKLMAPVKKPLADQAIKEIDEATPQVTYVCLPRYTHFRVHYAHYKKNLNTLRER